MENTNEKFIYAAEVGGKRFEVVWSSLPHPKDGQAETIQGPHGAKIVLYGPSINISAISHEIHHAVAWFAALTVINGREQEASAMGLWSEYTLAGLLKAGWEYSNKTKGAWLIGVQVAVSAPKEWITQPELGL